MPKANARLRRGLLESVEIHHHHIDGLDAVSRHGGFVLRVAANVEQASMHARVQRLHSAIEHLRKTGQFADVLDRQTGLAQRLCRPAGRNQLNPKTFERPRKFDEPAFVGNTQQRPPNRLRASSSYTRSTCIDFRAQTPLLV